MEAHPRTRFGPRGLILGGGREVDFFSGEIHYWRLARSAWAPCLAAVKRLGFEIVSTYVPWSVHESGPGAYDFAQLTGFLDEVERAGMFAVLKPGPHINAELTHFGFPDRVVADPAMQARSARGTPIWFPSPPHMFPVPSYASAAFRAAACDWLRAFGEVAAPRLHPDGPVVALQVDNEFQHFFRLGAHDGDYHPDAIAWWKEEADTDLDPPRAFDPERSLRWVAFKEVYAQRALAWVARGLDDAGLGGVARYHNAPPSLPHLTHLPRAASAVGGPAGLDFYHQKRDYRAVRRRALYLGGTGRPLPIAAEVGLGGPPWLPPMTQEDQAAVTRGILAGGARGLCFFMVVDRDRWYGAPVSQTGTERPPAEDVRRLLAALRAIEWTSLRRRAPVALVMSRAEARHAIASSMLDPISPVVTELLDLGPGGAAELSRDPAPALHRRWTDAVETALDRAGVAYSIVDEDAPDEAFSGYRLIVAPTLARTGRALWRRLHRLAAGGVQVVVGPERPAVDELDRPLGEDGSLPRRVGLLREASLEDLDGLARDLAAAAGDGSAEIGDAHVSVFVDAQGEPRAFTVGSPLDEACRVSLSVPPGTRLVDPLSDERFAEQRGHIEVDLDAHGVRLLAVEA
jgi:beta-galactosidase